MVTKWHLSYKQFADVVITETEIQVKNIISNHSLNGLKHILP